jgi:hypothetical protein
MFKKCYVLKNNLKSGKFIILQMLLIFGLWEESMLLEGERIIDE